MCSFPVKIYFIDISSIDNRASVEKQIEDPPGLTYGTSGNKSVPNFV